MSSYRRGHDIVKESVSARGEHMRLLVSEVGSFNRRRLRFGGLTSHLDR